METGYFCIPLASISKRVWVSTFHIKMKLHSHANLIERTKATQKCAIGKESLQIDPRADLTLKKNPENQ